jgi:hypothetical protein
MEERSSTENKQRKYLETKAKPWEERVYLQQVGRRAKLKFILHLLDCSCSKLLKKLKAGPNLLCITRQIHISI